MTTLQALCSSKTAHNKTSELTSYIDSTLGSLLEKIGDTN